MKLLKKLLAVCLCISMAGTPVYAAESMDSPAPSSEQPAAEMEMPDEEPVVLPDTANTDDEESYIPKEEQPAAVAEDSIPEPAEAAGEVEAYEAKTVALNGICALQDSKKIEMGVAYTSNDDGITFRWQVYDLEKKEWHLASDWSAGNWSSFQPAHKGNYWLYVEARTSDGKITTQLANVYFEGIKVQLNGICALQNSKKIDMGVAYTSNDDGITFRWQVYDLEKKEWHLASDWSAGNWSSFQPAHKGNYWLYVEAKTSDGKITTQLANVYFAGIKFEYQGMCILPEDGKLSMGAAYTTNDDGIEFRWQVYDLEKQEWHLASDWSAGNWSEYKPEHAGYYWLCVQIKTSDQKVAQYIYSYYVQETAITSFKLNVESPYWVGERIVLTGEYTDLLGKAGLKRYLVYDGAGWSVLEDNVWVPEKTGSYLLCYEIYDKDGKVIDQEFIPFNIEQPYVNINGINVRDLGNFTCTASVNVSTNDKNIEYLWMYYDVAQGQWRSLTSWTKTNEVKWSTGKEGHFWVHVKVRIHNNITREHTVSHYVNRYSSHLNGMIQRANQYSSDTQYIILVDRNAHKVAIMQGRKNYWSPLKYWDCANGKASTPTVAGVFKIQNRGYYFDSGNARCFWWTQFYGNYLFHTVLCNKDGSIQDGRVGMALSHGCVRLQVENAKWLYDNIPRGTTVVIY